MRTGQTEDVHLLTSAIKQLDTEINNLYHRRSQLLTKLNTLTSATRHLPPEILTEIFRLSACKTNIREPEQLYYLDLYDVLRVGWVCTQWRRVAWCASKLWTTCLLTQTVPVDLISVALGNCQPNNTGGVSVRVDLDDMYSDRMDLLFDQHRTKIGALRVYLPDEGPDIVEWWNRLAGYFADGDFPKLRELWVHWPEPLRGREIRGQALSGSRPDGQMRPMECIPWRVDMSQLNVLRLNNVPVDQCVQLLLQCSNLVEFHCVDPISPSGMFDPAGLLPVSDRPISLPNIKKLRWRVSNEGWNVFVFSSVRFPALERLFLGFTPLRSQDMLPSVAHVLYEVFLPALSSIRALDLELTMPTPTNFARFMGCTSFDALEKLYIVTSTYHIFITRLEMLTISQNSRLLPKLTMLHLDIRSLDISEPRAFAALRRFLTSRRGRHENRVQLERIVIDTTQAPWWLNRDQMDVLSGFIADGLIVEVASQKLGEEHIQPIL